MSKRYIPIVVIFSAIIFLANSGNHPTSGTGGYTGAPGDNVCSSCHGGSGNGITGDVSISGLPTNIVANTTYPLTITVNNTGGSPTQAGFQILALNNLNLNSGTFTNNGSNTSVKMTNGRTYVGHNPAQSLSSGGSTSWTVDWIAPNGPNGQTITLYAGAIMGNGAGGNSGDKFVASNISGTISGATAPVTVSTSTLNNVSCNGGADGSAMATATGGTSPYTYVWSNGENGATAIGLTAGMHTVTATDSNNSMGTATVTITEPAALDGIIDTQSDVLCHGESTGSASLSAVGGTAPYSFTWEDGSMNASRNDLSAGLYFVTLTDLNNCSDIITINIGEPAPLSQSLVSSTDATCGQADGAIEILGNGGVSPYNYQWSNGSSGPIITMIPTGTYIATVTDINGCTNSMAYSILSSSGITADITSSADVTCFGGNDGFATVAGGGGSSPYSFDWSDGGIGSERNDLIASNYTITVTDNLGCSATTSVNINEPPALVAAIESVTPPSCPGDDNGIAELSATGGTAPIFFNWPDGQSGNIVDNLSAGVYNVTVVDVLGCETNINVTITDPDAITMIIDSTQNVLCNGDNNGYAEISITGGTGNITLSWPDGNNSSIRSDLSAGQYWVSATDANSCQDSISIIISQPTVLIANAQGFPESSSGANDGSASAAPTGGTAPYTFMWSTGETTSSILNLAPGNYVVTVTDDNDCTSEEIVAVAPGDCNLIISASSNPVSCFGESDGSLSVSIENAVDPVVIEWSTGDNTENVNNVSAGVYSVTVTDALNCQNIESGIEVGSPGEILVTGDIIQIPVCATDSDGIISVKINGGTSPFTYEWELGSTSDTLNGVFPGVYPVTVTDANLCTGSGSVALGNGDFENPDIVLNDLILYIDESGNVPSFDQNDFDGGSSDNCGISGFDWDQNNYDCSDIGSQMIVVNLIDVNGNISQDSFQLTILDTIPPNVICTQDLVFMGCNNIEYNDPTGFDNCGIADVRLVEGPESGSSFDIGTTTIIYEIEDNGGNISLCTFNITVDVELNYDFETTDVSCFGLNDGNVSFTFSGTNLPFQVLFEDPETNPDALEGGNYPIIIQDANGCQVSDVIEINEPEELGISINEVINATDFNSTDGSIDIDINGGTPPYNIQWYLDGGIVGIDEDIVNAGIGFYTVVISDANGCGFESDDIEIGSTVSTHIIDLDQSLIMFPNPASNQIFFELKESSIDIELVRVLDMQGRLVETKKMNGLNSLIISDFKEGLYMVHIQTNKGLALRKLSILP